MKTLMTLLLLIFGLSLGTAQIPSQMIRTSPAQAITISTAFTDTLDLGSTYTVLAIRGTHSAEDTVLALKGLVNGAFYVLSAVADDTTIVLVDGANLKLSGNIRLDAITDRLLCWSDGTNLYQVAPVSNND